MSNKLASAILAGMKAREEVLRTEWEKGDDSIAVVWVAAEAEREAFEQAMREE